jgi:hypothetical protein
MAKGSGKIHFRRSNLDRSAEHIRQGKGGEALELVDVDKERVTLGGRRIRPAESGKPEGRYEQATQK